jgi:hypothetical protein
MNWQLVDVGERLVVSWNLSARFNRQALAAVDAIIHDYESADEDLVDRGWHLGSCRFGGQRASWWAGTPT